VSLFNRDYRNRGYLCAGKLYVPRMYISVVISFLCSLFVDVCQCFEQFACITVDY